MEYVSELPSELSEPPINPLLIHMVAPSVEENNPLFSLQVTVACSHRSSIFSWDIIERAYENKNRELVDFEKGKKATFENRLKWMGRNLIWRWREVLLLKMAFELIHVWTSKLLNALIEGPTTEEKISVLYTL